MALIDLVAAERADGDDFAFDGRNRRERRDAAGQLVRQHPEWSDRRIAELCGVSPKTVAQLRDELRGPGGGEPAMRVGRDGRARPVDAAARRALVAAALEERPDASLRAIARSVGVSPETVRSVRQHLGRKAPARPVVTSIAWRPEPPAETWHPDVAFTSREDSAATASFFERTDVCDGDLERHVHAIPLSRVYEVADEARRRAAFWTRLAQCAEAEAERGTR